MFSYILIQIFYNTNKIEIAIIISINLYVVVWCYENGFEGDLRYIVI